MTTCVVRGTGIELLVDDPWVEKEIYERFWERQERGSGGSAEASYGRTSVNLLPNPGVLVAVSVPPLISAKVREI